MHSLALLNILSNTLHSPIFCLPPHRRSLLRGPPEPPCRPSSQTKLYRLLSLKLRIHTHSEKMFCLRRNQFQFLRSQSKIMPLHINFYLIDSQSYISSLSSFQNHSNSASPSNSSTFRFPFLDEGHRNPVFCRDYSARVYTGPISRSLRKRINKRAKAAMKPVLNETLFNRAISHLPPRFTHEELHDVIAVQGDPLVCWELFNWASQQHRFRHNVLTFHVTIKKLGAAKMYEEMDYIVNQVLAIPSIGSEALYNSMIYYFTEARKLVRAVNIYKHMHDCRKLDCRPSLKTYNILFAALLSRGKNSYINHMYMETIRCLFKQMVDDGIEPDIFCLNCMIKGYVLSLHINDALRIFHQMDTVYNCQPNSFSYDYLIHGLCAQGRTKNAKELYDRMKNSGFVSSSKSYNSLVSSLALEGEVDEAVKFLWEMAENQRLADFITYRTVLDELSRQKGIGEALKFNEQLREKNLVDAHTHKKLTYELEDNAHNSNFR